MKFVCIQGGLQGEEYEVVAPGISIGREHDNDIVLAHEKEVSRYHAKVTRINDVWHITDNGSKNGVYLNDERIEAPSPLSIRDEIRIGGSLFLFTDDAVGVGDPEAGDTRATIAFPSTAAPDRVEDADPAEAEHTRPSAGRRGPPRTLILIAALVFVIVIVFGSIVIQEQEAARASGEKQATGVGWAPQELQVYYENLEATPHVLFRYELVLAKGRLQVTVDDVVNGRRIEETRQLEDEQLGSLGESLLRGDFLALSAAPAGRRHEGLSRTRLLVRAGTRGNYVEVENAITPEAFEATVAELVDFVRDELGILAEPIPREEALKRAEEEFLNARRFYAEKTVDEANLYRAICSLRQLLERLAPFDYKPEWHPAAHALCLRAEGELDEELDRRVRNAMTLKRAGNLEGAGQMLQSVLGMVPGQDHDAARDARKELIKVNRLVRERQKKR